MNKDIFIIGREFTYANKKGVYEIEGYLTDEMFYAKDSTKWIVDEYTIDDFEWVDEVGDKKVCNDECSEPDYEDEYYKLLIEREKQEDIITALLYYIRNA